MVHTYHGTHTAAAVKYKGTGTRHMHYYFYSLYERLNICLANARPCWYTYAVHGTRMFSTEPVNVQGGVQRSSQRSSQRNSKRHYQRDFNPERQCHSEHYPSKKFKRNRNEQPIRFSF